jgi:lysophospholipase L1-like esterase
MLGTNDLKSRFGVSACDISLGAGALVELALASKSGDLWGTPKVLLVSPIHIGDNIRESEFGEFFDTNSVVEVSRRLSACYQKVAAAYGCAFFDAATVAKPSPVDALHLDKAGHHQLGFALAEQVKNLLNS